MSNHKIPSIKGYKSPSSILQITRDLEDTGRQLVPFYAGNFVIAQECTYPFQENRSLPRGVTCNGVA